MRLRLETAVSPYGFSWVLFTPAQVEEITGLSPVMQADWRRRGILPKHEGHARFNALEIAEILLLRMSSDHGIGPQFSKHVARLGAEGVVLAALQNPEAWWRVAGKGRVSGAGTDRSGLKRYSSETKTARFLVWWADGSIEWVTSLSAALRKTNAAHDAKVDGPLIVFDTHTLGRRFVERTPLPLAYDHRSRGRRD